jgi:hypothetical protein
VCTPVYDSEVNAAMDDVRKAVERFIELGFKYDCAGAVFIDSALMNVRAVITDAILAAFPRAEDDCRRSHLILMLDAISPPDHEEALALLRRLAAEDPDAEVRPFAAQICRNLEDRSVLEAEQDRLRQMGEWDRGRPISARPACGCRPADGPRREVEPLGLRLEVRLAVDPGRYETSDHERSAR